MSSDRPAQAHSVTVADPSADTADRDRRYWRDNLGLTAGLLALWFVVSFGFVFWAAELNFSVFGWPFSFWMAAQGALLVYCAIVWFYAWVMGRRDAEYRADEEHQATP